MGSRAPGTVMQPHSQHYSCPPCHSVQQMLTYETKSFPLISTTYNLCLFLKVTLFNRLQMQYHKCEGPDDEQAMQIQDI